MTKQDLKDDGSKCQRQRRYTLDELLTQCDSKAPQTEEEREWLDAEPVGSESI